MARLPEYLGYFVALVSMAVMCVGFVTLLKTIQKTNRIRASSLLISTLFSIAMLIFNILMMKQVEIRWWFVLLLVFGGGFGFAWGTTTQLRMDQRKVMGKRSVLYIYFWLVSLLMTQMLAFFAKINIVAFGLASMFFSTGASLGTNGNILYRMRVLLQQKKNIPVRKASEIQVEGKIRYCMHCGSALEGNMQFCPQCGRKLEREDKKRNGKRLWVYGAVSAGVVVLAITGYFLLRSLQLDRPTAEENPASESAAQLIDPKMLSTQAVQTLEAQPAVIQPSPTVQPESEAREESEPEASIPSVAASGDYISVSFDAISGASLVPAFSEEYMRYFQAEGMGVIESTGFGGLLPIMEMNTKMENFSAFFDFMMPEAHAGSSCGLLFRSKGTITEGFQEFYGLFLYPRENVVKMGIWVDDGWVFSQELTPNPAIKNGYDPNSIQLEVEGNSMKIYVNEQFVGDFSEETLTEPGFIGLFLFPSGSIPEGEIDYVLLDNLLVVVN